MRFIIILQILLHNIEFLKTTKCPTQKSKLIPKIKCTILLKQLYYMYYNMRPKSAPNGVTVMCFHLRYLLFNYLLYFYLKIELFF